jgi:enolase
MIVRSLDAFEILDSRGIPTLQATLTLDGVQATASVPSGKSTGKHEACELRDGDLRRHNGKGVLRAVEAVRNLGMKLEGRALPSQPELDQWLIEQDGTPNKTHLGANALLGVSIAAARARVRVRRKRVAPCSRPWALIRHPRCPCLASTYSTVAPMPTTSWTFRNS